MQLELLVDAESTVDDRLLMQLLRDYGLSAEVQVDVELVVGRQPDARTSKCHRLASQDREHIATEVHSPVFS